MPVPKSQIEAGSFASKEEIRDPPIPLLTLDATTWRKPDDIYTAFFAVVGAPAWHGRNLDALNDSIVGGCINEIEYPYRIEIRGWKTIDEGAKVESWRVVQLWREVGIEVRLEGDGEEASD